MIKTVSILQIIVALTALAFLLTGIFKYIKRQRSQTFFKLMASVIIWGSIFVFSIFPSITHSLSAKLGFGESLNTLIFIGFVIIFIILTKIINIIERIEKNISEIVRKEALSKINQTKTND
ncbi:MAG: hypothetical protein COX30_04760 [Candidatus Moranbacteria bacterium CG23_combo_of_CG06-09_8_20_14_all_39_10]|nr:MAG: hypothetical protein COX30_04760 [Candidatus Moranbacteria bacterium CG23_combo_of_CG06-09_8_20_14_all_39_10]